MIVQLMRFMLLTAGAFGGYSVARLADWPSQTGFSQESVIILFIILGSSLGYLLGGILGREIAIQFRRIEQQVSEFQPAELVFGALGLIVGLMIAYFVSDPLRLLKPAWLAFLAVSGIYAFFGYGAMRLFLLRRHEVARQVSLQGASRTPERPKFLDSSAVIDGRFEAIVESGFLEGPLRVPRFVLAELQTLADSADDLKRARGRRGLDALTALAARGDVVTVVETDFADVPTVDAKMIRLAAGSGGAIVTADHNLTQVARVEGIDVLNINELAQALRPVYLPGDKFVLRVAKPGKEPDQGVGYLDDGTMVVVADGRDAIGREVEVEATSVLQTSAGRMIFAKAV
ncbi:MAG: PIN/TRAM domain-containing protein [Coriobacteriia bacterium]|nr:PIN/TRAM domain-containing protein [Coriobacteriia bacterium]